MSLGPPDRLALLEAVTQALVDPVFVLDRDGRYLEAFGGSDRAAYDSSAYLVGKTLHDIMPAALADGFLADVRRVIDTGQPHVYEYTLSADDCTGNAHDGPSGPQWFMGRIAPIVAGAGDVPDCVAWVVINITRRRQLEAELQRFATTDELTGLLNRRAFLARLETAMETTRTVGLPLALAILDLDHFKAVNDRFGHAVGDAFLRYVAKALLAWPAAGKVLGRIGGEEFAVLFEGLALPPAAALLREWQTQFHARPFELADQAIGVAFSAGVVAMADEDASTTDLLRRADHWLYEAKHAGRGRVAYPGWIDRRLG
ncbi:MAG: GGDEF domain-containing protein [Silanimonas sp.]|nr:MAG: GGDEF domain-containing protein [Silanimonas sp.]GIX40210.1 MAG: GGDEF domain-containing protein [Silanimonas sp.]